jgi:hypothetical protein
MQEFRPFLMYLLSLSVDAMYPQSTQAKDCYHNVTVKYANTKRHSVTILFNNLRQIRTVLGNQIMSVPSIEPYQRRIEDEKQFFFLVSILDEGTEQISFKQYRF